MSFTDVKKVKPLKLNKDWALLYGILLGDGCLSHYFSKQQREFFVISITGNYYNDRPFFENVLVPLLSSFRGKQVKIKERPKGGRIDINFSDEILFHKIKSLEFPVGKKGPNIIIPKIFYKGNLLKYIMQGFFATDGSLVLTKNPNKFYPRLEAQAIHKTLILQIYNYLASLGIKGHFYRCKFKPDPRWKVVQKRYKFQFNGKRNLLLFNNLVGFVNPKHKQRFLNFLAYSRKYDKERVNGAGEI